MSDKELKKHCGFFQSFSEHYTSRWLLKRLDLGMKWSDEYDDKPKKTLVLANYSKGDSRLFEEIPLYVNDFESFSNYLVNSLIPRVEEWIKRGKPETDLERENREAHEKLLCSFLYPTLLDEELDAYLELQDGKPVITTRGEDKTEIPPYVTEDTWEEFVFDHLYWKRKWPKCVNCGKKYPEEVSLKEWNEVTRKWEYTCPTCRN